MTIPIEASDEDVRTAGLADIGPEPFRLLFPAAVVAGVVGVALWPLFVWGARSTYPGLEHARLMTYGLFGGFILGFLGTVIPRQTGTRPLSVRSVLGLVAVHLGMVAAYAVGWRLAGDVLAASLLVVFVGLVWPRVRDRRADPPPGFVLVALALACALAGACLSIADQLVEVGAGLRALQRLMAYQGFVLLPILGVGTFILPGLLGTDASTHFAPEMLMPGGKRNAVLRALAVGAVIIASFFVEAWLSPRLGHAVRLAAVLWYLWRELPLHRGPRNPGTMGTLVRVAFAAVTVGYASIVVWPGLRVGLLHVTLIGGFALVTFVVGARVAFGHGGGERALAGPLRWLWISGGVMLFAMATRLSADLWPQVQFSHYAYGALAWLAGVAVWAWFVLPRMRRTG